MEVEILFQNANLRGDLETPTEAIGLIIFAQGDGGGRLSSKNVFVARELNKEGFATLLFDLLTEEEFKISKNRFNIDLLTERLIGVTKWCMEKEETQNLKIGYFGVGTGSAAALSAAAFWGTKIGATVSLDGKPDLAMEELDLIEAPVLLIVGGEDNEVISQNRKAFSKIGCTKKMEIVVGATQTFGEEGVQEKVVDLAKNWFAKFILEDGVK